MVDYAVDIYQQLNGTDEARGDKAGWQRGRAAAGPGCAAWEGTDVLGCRWQRQRGPLTRSGGPCCLQVPDSLRARRVEVVTKLKSLEAAVRPITDFLSNEDNVKLLKQDKAQNQAFLLKEFQIGARAAGGRPGQGAGVGGESERGGESACLELQTPPPNLPACRPPLRRRRPGAGGRAVPLCQVEL